jgi:uncharacterized membrane protein
MGGKTIPPVFLLFKQKRSAQMNTFIRRGLTVVGIAAVVLIVYQFFFHFWAYYPAWGWNFRYLGPRIFTGFPLLGLLIMVGLGFAMVKLISHLFSSRSGPQKIELTFCPFCGRDLRWAESKSSTIEQSPPNT